MGLYPYQQKVKSLIQSGKSVILQAPTGAGKTRAALAPFIESFFTTQADGFPRKCIYSVPMRVLANQFVTEYGEMAADYSRKFRRELNVSIQTGDRPDDAKVESNLLFTTIDQTLSNFLNIPYGLGSSSANLNAGAVMSSYLVFDELHLYDANTMLPTTLEMLRMIKDVTPFIIMTATFSSSMLGRLASLLDAVVVPETAEERVAMEQLGTQVGKQRVFRAVDRPLTAQMVLNSPSEMSEREARRVICICNTVRAAQRLYLQLKKMLAAQGDEETEVCLLHSRFYKDDRDAKEAWVEKQFKVAQAKYDGPRLILVATQVIEVGVDATCDVMHTELAPAASLLQRAGRCARRANERGEVFVYLPRNEDGAPDYAPYFLPSQASRTNHGLRLCEGTWDALQLEMFSGVHMSFEREQALIDRVHTPIDEAILQALAENRSLHRDEMFRTMASQERGMASELIRNINSRFVLVHPNPQQDEKLVRNPWHYDGFTLYPGTLAKAFVELSATVEADWLMQGAKAKEEERLFAEEEKPVRLPTEYIWYPLPEANEVFLSPVVAVHPKLAHYDAEVGLLLQASDEAYVLRERSGKGMRLAYAYERETFAEHVAGLYKAYRYPIYAKQADGASRTLLALADEIAFVARRLENNPRYRLKKGMIDRMVRACIACHDLGKLNEAWQAWAHSWQKRVGKFHGGRDMSLPADYMAAHTDFDPTKEQRKAQSKLGKRPPHAGESAMAADLLLDTVADGNKQLWRAGMTAIARHHSAKTSSYQPFKSHSAAGKAIEEALQVVGLPNELLEEIELHPDGEEVLEPCLVEFYAQGVKEVLLYFLLVRVLRLADQRSQE